MPATKHAVAVITECSYCLTTVNDIELRGQTQLPKQDTLVPFVICVDCHRKLYTCGAANQIEHRHKFWKKVKINLKRQVKQA